MEGWLRIVHQFMKNLKKLREKMFNSVYDILGCSK